MFRLVNLLSTKSVKELFYLGKYLCKATCRRNIVLLMINYLHIIVYTGPNLYVVLILSCYCYVIHVVEI